MNAHDHLWMHFSRLSNYKDAAPPVIVRGDGAYVWDADGKRYLDGLAGLFVVQVGHGRHELADAMAKQAGELAYFPIWSYAHPSALALAYNLNLVAVMCYTGRRKNRWKEAILFSYRHFTRFRGV